MDLTKLRGGASGSPILDSRGIVIGIARHKEGDSEGKAIRYSAIRDILEAWQIEIPDPPEEERVVFTPLQIRTSMRAKNAKTSALAIYERMTYFLKSCGLLDVRTGDEAEYLLSLVKALLLS